jgi:hypothetical protein
VTSSDASEGAARHLVISFMVVCVVCVALYFGFRWIRHAGLGPVTSGFAVVGVMLLALGGIAGVIDLLVGDEKKV